MNKMVVYSFDNYRDFLTAQINMIKLNRKNFSIRAMAKHLGIGSTTLIEVLHGKKNLSLDLGYRIAEKLKLTTDEIHFFMQLITLDLAKDEKTKKFFANKIRLARKTVQKRNKIYDNPNQILNLKNAIILCLASTFESISITQVSFLLKNSTEESMMLLERLVQLKLLTQVERDTFKANQQNYLIEDKNKNLALIKYHTEALLKTVDSLPKDGADDRVIGSEVLSFYSHNLPEANKIINTCLDNLVELSNSTPSTDIDSVFLAGCQFIRLGRIK